MVSVGGVLILTFCLLGSGKSQKCTEYETSETERDNYYPWAQLPAGVTEFTFKVRAHDNAHIGLATADDDAQVVAEVVLGGGGNSVSYIRKCKQCNFKAKAQTPNLLSEHEEKEFYISFEAGLVKVGHVGGAKILSHQFDYAIDANYIGIHTGWGHKGHWEYCGVPNTNCHQGWNNYGNKCYKYFSTTKSWNDARKHCQGLGADLTSIHSTTEDAFIDNIRTTDNQATTGTWIGLNKNSQNKWVWIDGTNAVFYEWAPGQPDNQKGNQKCALIGWSKYPHQWDDSKCSNKRGFICEK